MGQPERAAGTQRGEDLRAGTQRGLRAVGEDELAAGEVTFKDLATGEQRRVPRSRVSPGSPRACRSLSARASSADSKT